MLEDEKKERKHRVLYMKREEAFNTRIQIFELSWDEKTYI